MASTDAATRNRDNPGLVSGKLVVIASIVVFVLIGVAFWAAGKWFSAHPIEADDTLDYANRAEWVVMPATTILLTEPPRYMRGPYGSKIKKELPFAISEEAEKYLVGMPVPLPGTVGRDLEARQPIVDYCQHAPLEVAFFATWLQWQYFDQKDPYFKAMQRSFADAPAVLVLQYEDQAGHPLVRHPIGNIELTFARKADDVLDDTLRLTYHRASTDKQGRVYLPVFDTPLQVSVKPDPPGYAAEYPFSGWLIFPGKVGGPEPIVVRPTADREAD